MYWAKNDIFDTIVTGKTKVFLAGIFADYRELIIKNDYWLRGGEGDIWSKIGYLLITGGWYMGYNRGGLAWGQLTNYAFVAQCSLHADYVGDHDDHYDEDEVSTGDYCQLCPWTYLILPHAGLSSDAYGQSPMTPITWGRWFLEDFWFIYPVSHIYCVTGLELVNYKQSRKLTMGCGYENFILRPKSEPTFRQN